MLLSISNLTKSIGAKDLYKDLTLNIDDNDKVGFIGRNGTGKTTLFRIVMGEDKDFKGSISIPNGKVVVQTEQEHSLNGDISPLEYVLSAVPKYKELKKILKDYEESGSSDVEAIGIYTDAVMQFSEFGYYTIEDEILLELDSFGLTLDQVISPIKNLSGGEKRFVELAKVIFSNADLALIDEPTNHMDYIGKAKFIEWLAGYKKGVIVISHDRDVLQVVNKVIELSNHKIKVFKGSYEDYLSQNANNTLTSIRKYQEGLKLIEQYKAQMLTFQAKISYGGSAIAQRDKFKRLWEDAKANTVKPSFWIDEESLGNMDEEITDTYDTYKSRALGMNLKSDFKSNSKVRKIGNLELLKVENLTFGYTKDKILLKDLNLTIAYGDRLHIKGRNGVGKSTFLKLLIEKYLGNDKYKLKSGSIEWAPKAVLGVYEQEVGTKYFEYTLEAYIYEIYAINRAEMNDQKMRRILSQYLFDPVIDKTLQIKHASGGQKARLQIIKMLVNNPNIIILDEPTNHLDLPSIEETEKALIDYEGAIIYVSHDKAFVSKIGGDVMSFGVEKE